MMCEYCDGSKKPIKTEVDYDGYFVLTPDDSEYPEGYLLDVYGNNGEGWVFSFIVSYCPMCGARLRKVES